MSTSMSMDPSLGLCHSFVIRASSFHISHPSLLAVTFFFLLAPCLTKAYVLSTLLPFLVAISNSVLRQRTRRDFLSLAGKSLGLAALSSATVASLLKNVAAATH